MDKPRDSGRAIAIAVVVGALITPYVSRCLAVPSRGWSWLFSYLPSIPAVIFFAVFNLMHGFTLYSLAMTKEGPSVRFWVATAVSLLLVGYLHFDLDLASSSTAAIALLWIPIYGALAAVFVWWLIGVLFKRNAG